MRMLRFSDTRSVSFSVLARILLDPDSPPDSSIYRYSRGFYPFPIPARSVFRYSHGFYLIPVLPGFYHFSVFTLMVSYSGTRRVSFSVHGRILPDPGSDRDSTTFLVFPLMASFFGTRRVRFSVLAQILPDPGTGPDSTIFT